MDITSKNTNSDADKRDPVFAKFQSVTVFVRMLLSFFTLTEEDRLKAGVHRGSEGKDE